MIIRVETPDGTKRIETTENESTEAFIKKIQKEFNYEDLFSFQVYKERSHKTQLPLLERKTVREFGLTHGCVVYVVTNKKVDDNVEQPQANHHQNHNNNLNNNPNRIIGSQNNHIIESLQNNVLSGVTLTEEEVDQQLYGQSGLIERRPDPAVCRHGGNAKCVHCTSLEPYDDSYLKEHNIKHMSFHSYLKKLTNGIDKGKFAILENISCKIKPGCAGHAPWPQGICTKCQPSAITLNRQVYRHTDNVMFENSSIVENFLNYWRSTGYQRLGFLYGYYSAHKDVPLGIKATVVAIYEPPQESGRDFIKLVSPDKKSADVDFIAQELGLKRIGWVFTDLITDDIQKGTVKHLRHMNSHFLSAQECIMAGFLQNSHPNSCRYSPDGRFGSKFVTICITGDLENAVHMEGYQVSNQCMALVRDNCLLPTKDAPELGYVRESSSDQYVPDVFYTEKDGYGNEVKSIARPLPIEYLLVDVPVATPLEPKFKFNPLRHLKAFPIENRLINGQIQDFNALSSYLQQFNDMQFLEAMSDFHLLIYLTTMDAYPLKEFMSPLLTAIGTSNTNMANEWANNTQWQTVQQMIIANNSSPSTSGQNHAPIGGAAAPAAVAIPAADAPNWSCNYCTFENDGHNNTCEMCSLPKE